MRAPVTFFLLVLLTLATAAATAACPAPAPERLAVAEDPGAEKAPADSGTTETPPTRKIPKLPQSCDANPDDDEDAALQWPPDVAAEQERLAALPRPDGADQAQRIVRRVSQADEFGTPEYRPDWKWEWRWSKPDLDTGASDHEFGWLKELVAWLEKISAWFGTTMHVLLWLVLLVLLLLLWRYRAKFVALWPQARRDARIVAGIDIVPLLKPDALPEDVVAGAGHLWRAGEPREALSLLYRAALHRLGERLAFAIPPSGTELECLALVARHADSQTTAAFRVLVNGWSRMAWQHQPPADLAPLVDAYRRAASGADAALLPGRDQHGTHAGGAA